MESLCYAQNSYHKRDNQNENCNNFLIRYKRECKAMGKPVKL